MLRLEFLGAAGSRAPRRLVIDGHAILESPAIATHLADAYPAASLAPPPGTLQRAHYYQWFFFMANTLQPAYRAWFYPTEPAGEANSEASQAMARERSEAAWQRVDTQLGARCATAAP